MPKKQNPGVPSGLRSAGTALWLSVAPNYQLRSDEMTRLEQACKTADALAMLEDAWESLGFPMVSVGSMKQEVIHPLIGEIRTQRGALASLLAGLKLPDAQSGETSGDASTPARKAAAARWSRGA